MKIKILKIIGWIMAIAGVVITFGNNKGWFIDKNRQEVYKQLSTKGRVSFKTPGVNTFLDKYYYSTKPPPVQRLPSIPSKELILHSVTIRRTPPVVYVSVVYQGENRSIAFCSLEELRQWANETPLYAWLGLGLMAAGVSVAIITDICNFIKESKKS